jgi:hypothetical protein
MHPVIRIGIEEITSLSRQDRAILAARCARLALNTLADAPLAPGPHFTETCEWAVRVLSASALGGEDHPDLSAALESTARLADYANGSYVPLWSRVACAVTAAVAAVHDDSPLQALIALACAKRTAGAVYVEDTLLCDIPALCSVRYAVTA